MGFGGFGGGGGGGGGGGAGAIAGVVDQGIGELGAGISAILAGKQRKKALRAYAREIQTISRVETDRMRRGATALRGAQVAAYASSGVDPNRGSPLLIQAQSAWEEGLKREFVLWTADRRAFALRQQAQLEFLKGVQKGISHFANFVKGPPFDGSTPNKTPDVGLNGEVNNSGISGAVRANSLPAGGNFSATGGSFGSAAGASGATTLGSFPAGANVG